MTQQYQDVIRKAYTAFNARDINAAITLMHPEVNWPNGWEGGYVKGHEEIRDYWTRQWKEIDPRVEPVELHEKQEGKISVKVHQIVYDLQGKLLSDGWVTHVYTIENGLIKDMEIEKP